MTLRIPCLAASLLCVASWGASAQTLSVGDDAPALKVSQWAKGEKVDRLEPDRTYVVEFWATWCGPCRTSIPHLTELQKKYKDKGLRVIGVSVFEQDPKKVAPFVEEMGDKMDYAVALDDVPEGEKGNAGKMAETWMNASGSEGIPTAFIVTKGKVAWIGHPMQMDGPLARVISGTFDVARAAREFREEKAAEQKMMAVFTRLRKLGRDAPGKDQLAVIDEAIAESPTLERGLGYQKFLLMSRTGDEAAPAYGRKLVAGVFKDDAEALNNIAWSIVDPEGKPGPGHRDVKLALLAATRADELTRGENGPILDTLALAYFETGDAKKALAAQEKAVKLMDDGDGDEGMKERLAKYRKAVGEEKP